MEKELQELKHKSERLEALQACRNLMGKYSYYHAAFRNLEFVELWAKRDDCLLKMPFGIFDGWEGVRRCYVDIHGDRTNPEVLEMMKGMMMIHEMCTEVLEVAEDGQTAKGAWITPGHETAPSPGKEKGAWSWGKYEVVFIKEEGVWKFWKLILFPLFLTPYNRSWGEPKLPEIEEGPQAAPDRALEEPFWEYGADAFYPENEPAIPLPYNTYK